MKKILERAFPVSLVFGTVAAICCAFTMAKPVFILVALSAGFVGFILGCLHIIAVQRYEIKQAPTGLLITSLFLNSVPLIYMMVIVMQAKR